jgi:hypothetical protein
VGRTKTGDGWTVSAVFQRVVPCLSGAQSMEAVHCAVVGAPSNTSHGDICSDEEGNQEEHNKSTSAVDLLLLTQLGQTAPLNSLDCRTTHIFTPAIH